MTERHHAVDRDDMPETEGTTDDVETIALGEKGVVLYDGENLQAWERQPRTGGAPAVSLSFRGPARTPPPCPPEGSLGIPRENSTVADATDGDGA